MGNTTHQILSREERNAAWRKEEKFYFRSRLHRSTYILPFSDRNNGEQFQFLPLSSFDYTPHFVLGILCQDYILENNIEKLMITI